ncbi:MAG: hypothetical protein ACP5JT_00895 [Thermoplasmata archaeon]
MRKILAISVILSVFMLSLASIPSNGYTFGNLKFPSIVIHMLNGENLTITDTIWKEEIFPIFFTKSITTYNWSSDPKYKYVFFDYNLSSLNLFGAEFVFELEHYSNITLKTIADALLQAIQLPSPIKGYTNGQLLDMGILPGFANVTIPQKHFISYSIPWQIITIVILIISIVIVYYIFKPKE